MHFAEALDAGVLLFDGAMGTMLAATGIDDGGCVERLNLTHPEAVRDTHALYRMAGADVVETNTLGANRISLRKHGLDGEVGAIIESAVKAAREAVKPDGFVALSMSTTGQLLEPLGTLRAAEAYEAYWQAALYGMNAGADLIFIETMGDIAEARIAALAAREATLLPVAVSFTFERNGRTLMGGTPEACALALRAAGASALGINCSTGPDEMRGHLEAMRAVCPLPVIVQPNAGLPYVSEGRTLFPLSAEGMQLRMTPLLDGGAAAIGGCCGTTPEHILRMRALLDGRRPPQSAYDGVRRVSSPRSVTPLDEALVRPFRRGLDMDALYDIGSDVTAVMLDIRGASPEAIAAFLPEAQQATHLPFIFQADDDAALRAALMAYHGAAAVSCGPELHGAAAAFGAEIV